VRPDGSDGPSARMHDIAPGLDRYEASVAPDAPGDWHFRVEGWSGAVPSREGPPGPRWRRSGRAPRGRRWRGSE